MRVGDDDGRGNYRTWLPVVAFIATAIVCFAAVGVHGLRNISPDDSCEPGELVFVGFCNLCLCSPKGMPNQLCARSWCPVKTMLPPRSSTPNPRTYVPFTEGP